MSTKHFYFYVKTLNKNWQIDKTIFITNNHDIIKSRSNLLKSGGVMLDILQKEVLTQKDIDQLNTLLSNPQCNTLKKVVKKLMGEEASATDVNNKHRELYAKIKDSGYKSNPDTKLYELNRDTNKTNKENKKTKTEKQTVKVVETESVKDENKEVETPKVTTTKTETPSKKTRRTKKEIEAERLKAEYEENIKINPLQLISSTGNEITDKLFYSSKDKTTGTGVYLLPSIVEEFKAVEEVFSHIYNYKLIDASIQLTYSERHYLMESNIFMDFMRLMNNDKLALKREEARRKGKMKEYEQRKANGEEVEKPKFQPLKKQLNLKLSQTAINNLDSLCEDFSMFKKSEVINLCMFALSESAKTTFLSNN